MTKFNKATVGTLAGTVASLLAFLFPAYSGSIQAIAPLVIGAVVYAVPNQ